MNSTDIFALGLGLEKPWIVKKVEFLISEKDNSQELHIYLDFERGWKFQTQLGSVTAYDTVERKWQHLNFFQHRCILHARVPRVEDVKGKPRTVQVPWARGNSGFTLMFEAYAMLLIECEMPVNKVSKCLNVTAPRLWNVFDYWIEQAVSEDDLSSVVECGIDETSSKKGHEYVTVFVDMDKHRVIDIQEGKDKNTVEEFVYAFESKGGDRKQIEQVCIDMSPAFIAGVMDMLPNASLTFDKFHLVQLLNNAMDDVRKFERRGNDLIKSHKYTVLKDYDKLSKRKQGELDYLLMLYPVLGEAYRLKQMFKDVFDIDDPDEAKAYMQFWCDMAIESKIQPFIKFAWTIKAHWRGIANYFDSKLTNGILEGINSKIQLIKRRARGYRNIKNYMNMIYFCCGKLKFNYPQYSL